MGDRERAGDTGIGHPVWGQQTISEAGLRSLADAAMVQAADFGKLSDFACHGELDRPEVGCVLVQRKVGARLMVIGEVPSQDAVEVPLARTKT
jgi:hypothetical protein